MGSRSTAGYAKRNLSCSSAVNIMRAITAIVYVLIYSTAFADKPLGQTVQVDLRRGSFDTYHFVPSGLPRAVILFGSGDGGWGYVENHVSAFLKNSGFYVVGVDFRKYAKSDYEGPVLIADYRTIVADALSRTGHPELPVVYGGWSMGAVQAVAAAGSDQRSSRLVGLLLLSMGSRGRYGLRFTDEIGLAPEGKGTFAVADFTPAVANLRVVQFEAVGDWMNSVDWTKTLKTPHRLFELQKTNHDFDGINTDFQKVLLDGLNWILDPSRPAGDEAKA
jgi:phosphatidylglycerol lysyltransferase